MPQLRKLILIFCKEFNFFSANQVNGFLGTEHHKSLVSSERGWKNVLNVCGEFFFHWWRVKGRAQKDTRRACSDRGNGRRRGERGEGKEEGGEKEGKGREEGGEEERKGGRGRRRRDDGGEPGGELRGETSAKSQLR
jgi:hypothetical protein